MRRWQFWAGVAISLFFLYYVLRGLQFGDVWETLEGANYLWLIPGVLIYLVGVIARAWRWHYLLRPVKSIPTTTLFPITAIGYMGNNIYPARAGEVLRAIVLKKFEGVAISASLATIVVERVFDGIVMLGFVFLNLPELARLTVSSGFVGNIQTLALWGAGAFLGALVLFLLAGMYPERTIWFVKWISRYVIPTRFRDQVIGLAQSFLSGLAALRSPRDVLMIFFTSIVIWLLETGKYWFVMQAFPQLEVSFFTLMLMNGIVNLATTIPSAPGYVGTFDAPGIAVLQAYGVDKAIAAGYTLVLHAALWVPITALGAYYMARSGIKWDQSMERVRVEDRSK
ncbi:MAG: flippase-like domain-containing protein [Chloroflexi bacterium]|nr:flippase-like domain-containing protein [Chloroflexota bacterium]